MAQRIGLKAPNSQPQIAVVILAGGKSSRMGRDKAGLLENQHSGSDLLDRAHRRGCQLLAELGQNTEAVFVSGDYPKYPYIGDVIPACGPISGMHAALRFFLNTAVYGEIQRVLFTPIDMPAMKVSTLLNLVRGVEGHDNVYFVGFELPALISIVPETEALLFERLTASQNGLVDLSVRGFLRDLNMTSVEIHDQDTEFVNLNTPNDLALWRFTEESDMRGSGGYE